MQFRDNQQFAGYTILHGLGAGGMASVFLAEEAGLGRRVALKVMPSHLAEQSFWIERFHQEAAVIARLEHPNIVPVYRYGIECTRGEQVPWMALRYVDGGDMTARLREDGDRDKVLAMFDQLAAALDYAHARGIVHRDLKPHNVLVSDSGQVYLADFGIAKILEGSRIAAPTGDLVFGTPEYMAPEQALGREITSRVDIYSLGVMAFEWIAGRVPFQADTPHATLLKHVQQEVPTDQLHDVSTNVVSTICRALNKDPSERFPTAGAFITELRQAFLAQPVQTGRSRSKSNAGMALAGIAVSLSVAIAVYLSLPADHDVPDVATAHESGAGLPASEPSLIAEPTRSEVDVPDPEAANAVVEPRLSVDETVSVSFADSLIEIADLPAPDMAVRALISPERDVYTEGDLIEIGFILDEPGYPAVFVHSEDGSTTLLYPNDFEKAKKVSAKQLHWVGTESQRFRLQVGPPFGTDVVQVVAFRRMDELRLLLDALSLGAAAQMYAVDRAKLTRSMSSIRTRGIKAIEAEPGRPISPPVLRGWGEAQALLRTESR